jgi:formylglycine-generating enzyme required for sulfatase activity
MRIPSAKEWIHVAVGRKRMRYPWGAKAGRFANTIDISVNRPVPVGTFENGRVDLFGCYDMLGNVWEWVADEVRTPGWESDGSDGIAAQQAELTTDQPWRSPALTGPGGSREPAPVPRGL